MANIAYLFNSPPCAFRILFHRTIIFILSLAGIIVFATTIRLYRRDIASKDSQDPIDNSLIITNSIAIASLSIALIWSTVLLGLLCRRILYNYRRNSTGLATVDDTAADEQYRNRDLVHLLLFFFIDMFLWVHMAIVCGFVGHEVTQWRHGVIRTGSVTTKINTNDCPVIDPRTGLEEYYCSGSWKRIPGLSSSGLSIIATECSLIFWIWLYTCWELYCLRRAQQPRTSRQQRPSTEAQQEFAFDSKT